MAVPGMGSENPRAQAWDPGPRPGDPASRVVFDHCAENGRSVFFVCGFLHVHMLFRAAPT